MNPSYGQSIEVDFDDVPNVLMPTEDLQIHRRTNSAGYLENGLVDSLKQHSRTPSNGTVQPINGDIVSQKSIDARGYNKETRCGLVWYPSCFQRLAAPIPFLMSLCGVVIAQSLVVSGLLSSINTTIEKRYNLSSIEIGYIYSCYEISCLLATLVISYFGHKRNRAQLLGGITLLLSLGYLVMSLPHFLSSSYQVGNLTDSICTTPLSPLETSSVNCALEGSDTWALLIFCLGQLIIGAGASPIYVMGLTYLWDNVSPRQYPIYSAFMYASGAVGPALGFFLGAWFLSIYVDFPLITPPAGVTSSDAQWLGAWWIGMLFSAALAITASVPLLFFPKRLPPKQSRSSPINDVNTKKVLHVNGDTNGKVTSTIHSVSGQVDMPASKISNGRQDAGAGANANGDAVVPKKRNGERQTSESKTDRPGPNYGTIKDLPYGLKRLFTNKVWLSVSLLNVVEQSVVTAFTTYISKYLQVMFNEPANVASIDTGAVVIPSAITGVLLGGLVMRQYGMGTTGAAKLLIFCSVMTTSITIGIMFLGCEGIQFVGVNMLYPDDLHNSSATVMTSTIEMNLNNACNANCSCSSKVYQPVCSTADQRTFFSPCYAGCINSMMDEATSVQTYTNCSCVTGGEVSYGKCYTPCPHLIASLVLVFFQVFLTAIGQAPANIITLSTVSEEDRSFALGMQFFLVRILAFIPVPIYFGQIFDSTCLSRVEACGGEEGACMEYDLNRLPFYWLGTVCALKILGFVMALFTWLASRNRQSVDFSDNSEDGKNLKNSLVHSSLSLNKSVTILNVKPDDPDRPGSQELDKFKAKRSSKRNSNGDSLTETTLATSLSSLNSTGTPGSGAQRSFNDFNVKL